LNVERRNGFRYSLIKDAFKVNLPSQALQNPVSRVDRLGNTINDRAVFECMRKHPQPELYSVIPKGDRIKPGK
jgi:hypothetical protein